MTQSGRVARARVSKVISAIKEEQKAGSSFNFKMRRGDEEYIRAGRWKCPNNPETGAHHFVGVDGKLRCKYCPATRGLFSPMPARMKKKGGRKRR